MLTVFESGPGDEQSLRTDVPHASAFDRYTESLQVTRKMSKKYGEYYKTTLRIPDVSRDAVMNRLRELGSSGFIENNDSIVTYFPLELDIRALSEEMEGFRKVLRDSGLDPDFSFELVRIPGKDWIDVWKKNITPVNVGESFTVTPSWITADTERQVIVIDPGMAFGTGNHASTRLCLTLMEKFSRDIRKRTFLDIGTGTGILAIAAARLGFGKVTAIDTDTLAVETAQRNIAVNGCQDIAVLKGDMSGVQGLFDCITANLFSAVLVQNASKIALHLEPHGIAILSGIIRGQEEEVIHTMEEAGMMLKEKKVEREWISLAARRRT